ncbi:MAG: Poly(A) polymerase I [Chlamydiia bacterium]|nr:Poly(A) polymerase I [Chlamydiia bacterium]
MAAKKYTKKQHKINIDDIDPNALEVLETLQENGFKAYLVGGSVRDLLLGYAPKDYDISTDALPEEVRDIFPSCFIVGKRFRLAHVRINRKVYEVSTFRKGDNEDDTLIYNDNEWGTEEEDVKRRDFTVNGLFYDNQKQVIIDYVGGVEDAKKNLLRCIGNPYIRFKQDPVRMIRLLKFRARFGLVPDEEMLEALFALRTEVLKSSPARLLEEFLRMLESGASVAFLKNLQEHGFLQTLLPNLAPYFETPVEQTIYNYLHVVDRLITAERKRPPRRSVLVACLIYPILQERLHEIYQRAPKKVHLGKIHQEANDLTIDLFNPVLRITKKILAEAVGIMQTQYRFTPLQKKKKLVCKIPNTPNFGCCLKFFMLRTLLEPGLTDLYNEWHYYYEKHKKNNPREDKPRKRNGRRRKDS